MIKPYQLLLIVSGLVLVAALALWPGQWLPHATANVTLKKFTAEARPGQSKVYIDWTTATQFQTVGFYITRSDNASGPWTRVSDFIPREGDDLTGAQYPTWVDETTDWDHFYSYKLEEITQGDSAFYGPVTVTTPPAPTATWTPTPIATWTRTPTSTPMPTATPTTKRASQTSGSSTGSVATPHLATGATITPLPNLPSGSAGPEELTATPTFVSLEAAAQSAALVTTAAPPVLDAPTSVSVAPPLVAAAQPLQPQQPDPTLVPTNVSSAESAPVTVVTEAAPGTLASGSAGAAPVLVIAAFLFLGLAFVILRQMRQ